MLAINFITIFMVTQKVLSYHLLCHFKHFIIARNMHFNQITITELKKYNIVVISVPADGLPMFGAVVYMGTGITSCSSHVHIYRFGNPFGTETRIFQENQDNIMVADDLAPCTTIPSAAMAMTMQDKWFHVFHWGGFQWTDSSQCCDIIKKWGGGGGGWGWGGGWVGGWVGWGWGGKQITAFVTLHLLRLLLTHLRIP